MLSKISDNSPLRKMFIEGKDQSIYDTVLNYFISFKSNLWSNAKEKSYITKTVGVQASFDILKLLLKKENSDSPENINFNVYLTKAKSIDFSDKFFQASGIGRNRIKNIIGIATGLIQKEKIKKTDLPFYEDLLAGKNTSTEKERWIWEEEAENAIINILEKAEWNFKNKSVNLYLDSDYENSKSFSNYNSFLSKLSEIAEIAYSANLPSDNEFAEEQKEKFEADDLVQSCLTDYESNLKKLGWI
jgi:hypothetical protein